MLKVLMFLLFFLFNMPFFYAMERDDRVRFRESIAFEKALNEKANALYSAMVRSWNFRSGAPSPELIKKIIREFVKTNQVELAELRTSSVQMAELLKRLDFQIERVMAENKELRESGAGDRRRGVEVGVGDSLELVDESTQSGTSFFERSEMGISVRPELVDSSTDPRALSTVVSCGCQMDDLSGEREKVSLRDGFSQTEAAVLQNSLGLSELTMLNISPCSSEGDLESPIDDERGNSRSSSVVLSERYSQDSLDVLGSSEDERGSSQFFSSVSPYEVSLGNEGEREGGSPSYSDTPISEIGLTGASRMPSKRTIFALLGSFGVGYLTKVLLTFRGVNDSGELVGDSEEHQDSSLLSSISPVEELPDVDVLEESDSQGSSFFSTRNMVAVAACAVVGYLAKKLFTHSDLENDPENEE